VLVVVVVVVVVVLVVVAGGSSSSSSGSPPVYITYTSINKTKYLMILGIPKSIKIEFIIKLNEDKLRNAWFP
jgi:hypothetical protein